LPNKSTQNFFEIRDTKGYFVEKVLVSLQCAPSHSSCYGCNDGLSFQLGKIKINLIKTQLVEKMLKF